MTEQLDALVKRLDAGDPCGEYTCRVRDTRSGCTCTEAAAAIRQLVAERDALLVSVSEIARQKKTGELAAAGDYDNGDIDEGYDGCIDCARAALSPTASAKPE